MERCGEVRDVWEVWAKGQGQQRSGGKGGVPRASMYTCQYISCSFKVVLLVSGAVLLVNVAVWYGCWCRLANWTLELLSFEPGPVLTLDSGPALTLGLLQPRDLL